MTNAWCIVLLKYKVGDFYLHYAHTTRNAFTKAVTEAARPYHLGKKETYKQLSLKHVGNEKSFRMEFVSNQPITEVG